MCGIGGFLKVGGLEAAAAQADLQAMAAALVHRGPDGQGFWVQPAAGVAFCHRRLAIVDLSPLGAQPMHSVSGRFAITFNGEIYNYRALRAELAAQGAEFRGGSDTEVLLAAVERWGVIEALQRSRGMFALGLWDSRERELWLARDRFGEKPLYYGQFAQTLLFGSELEALRRHSAWKGQIDRNALAALLRHDFIPAPQSIFSQVRKLPAGCAMRICAAAGGLSLEPIPYWRPAMIASAPRSAHLRPSPGEEFAPEQICAALTKVHGALEESIRLQMVADVPVGAFLSGGIDSSLVVALMQRASSQPVRTFTIGFEEAQFNEAPHARQVAAHLGTQHTELTVTARDALDVIPDLARIYDEPFADSSQIPTYLVAKLARGAVTVALSGDAGDELFGGYSRYLDVRERWRRLQRAPAGLRRLAAQGLEALPPWAVSVMTAPWRSLSRLRGRQQVADRMQERARVWGAGSLPELYEATMTFWQPSSRLVLGAEEPAGAGWADATWAEGAHRDGCGDPLAQMMYADTRLYLPDDILVKVDRAAMAVSLETRVPLLDHQVAQAAWEIPTAVHLHDGRGKWVLRQLLERHVPRQLFDRPKSGFAVPIGRWLRGELKDWAGALLDPARLRREGYLEAGPIARRWQQHLQGEMNWSSHLWGVLMFQSWLEGCQRSAVEAGRSANLRGPPARVGLAAVTPVMR